MDQTSLEKMQNQLVTSAEAFAPELELVFKPMFGGACAYVKGRVFASLSHAGLALKFSSSTQTELLKEKGAKRLQYEPDAPVSKQYIVVPPQVQANDKDLGVWLKQSVDFVLAQPAPKSKRKKPS